MNTVDNTWMSMSQSVLTQTCLGPMWVNQTWQQIPHVLQKEKQKCYCWKAASYDLFYHWWGNEDTLILRYGVPAEQAPVVSLLMEIIAQWSHPGDHQIKMMTNNYPPDGFSFITYCWKLQALPWYKSLTACSWVFLRHKCWLASPE